MSREILEKYQPDLLVVYSGHNEFYGVFGQASRLALFDNQALVQLFLKLQRSKLALLLRNILVSSLGERIDRDSVIDHNSLMGTVAKDINIPLNSAVYQKTEVHFQKNLIEIIEEAQAHQTDILICNLVDNWGDLPPFSSIHTDTAGTGIAAKTLALLKKAEAAQESGQYRQAVSLFNQALQDMASNAGTHYQLGKCYEALQMYNLAKNHYRLAKDFDAIRFRAPSSFNRIIQEVAQKYSVPLANIEQTFSDNSPGGIVGSELLYEHVHPTQRGYLLLAKTVAKTMSDGGLISKTWNWSKDQPDSVYLAMCHLTSLDHEVANYTVFRLTANWPFAASGKERVYQRVGTERTEQLARALIDQQESNLAQLHLNLGQEYLDNKDTEQCLAEYEAALAIEPHCDIYNRIAPVYAKLAELAFRASGDYQSAAENYRQGLTYYQKGLQRCPEHLQLNFNLGLLYALRKDESENALNCFRRVLSIDPQHKNAMQMVVRLHFQRHEYEAAQSQLLQAVALYPGDFKFHRDLGHLYAKQKNYPEAETWLKKALNLKPNNKRLQLALQQMQDKQKGKKR